MNTSTQNTTTNPSVENEVAANPLVELEKIFKSLGIALTLHENESPMAEALLEAIHLAEVELELELAADCALELDVLTEMRIEDGLSVDICSDKRLEQELALLANTLADLNYALYLNPVPMDGDVDFKQWVLGFTIVEDNESHLVLKVCFFPATGRYILVDSFGFIHPAIDDEEVIELGKALLKEHPILGYWDCINMM